MLKQTFIVAMTTAIVAATKSNGTMTKIESILAQNTPTENVETKLADEKARNASSKPKPVPTSGTSLSQVNAISGLRERDIEASQSKGMQLAQATQPGSDCHRS